MSRATKKRLRTLAAPAETSGVPVDTLISFMEVARRLGVHTMTIRREVCRGHLQALRVGPRLLRIAPAELKRYIRRHCP